MSFLNANTYQDTLTYTTSANTANLYTGLVLSGTYTMPPSGGSYYMPINGMFTYTSPYTWPTLKDYTRFITLVTNNLPGFVLIQTDHVRNRCTIVKKHEALKALYIVYERLGYRTATDIIHVRDLQYTDNEFSLVIKPATCSEEILEELSITQPDLQKLLIETFEV